MFFAQSTLPFSLLLLLGGVVTKANGLRINNAQDLIDFSIDINNGRNYSGSTVYLGSDIDFTPSLSQQFEPIGKSESYPFQGTFDGQGHTISNLVLNSSSLYTGLFGCSEETTIKNVVLDETCSFINSRSSKTSTTASFSGYCASCIIENVVNMGSVTYIGITTVNFFAGGIVGRLLYSSTARNCVNYGSVTYKGTSTSSSSIGGIFGLCGVEYSAKFIQNCANFGTITNNGTSRIDLYMGRLLG